MAPKKKGNKKGGQPGSSASRKGSKLKSFASWFRVTLPHGSKYDKEFVLRSLLEHVAPIPFTPFCWSTKGASAIFYVDRYKLAVKLRGLNRQIPCPDGYNMLILVTEGAPYIIINENMKEKLKLTIIKRYNAVNKTLDLTRLHADPDLQDFFCALFKPIVLLTVIEIISANIPEIEALNLHENGIIILSSFRKFYKKLPHLKILDLGNNSDGIDLSPSTGFDLSPSIGFDIREEKTLPPTKQTFLCNDKAHGIVCQVLEQYFEILDSKSRQPLLQVYHENVVFSMTSTSPHRQNPKNANQLDWYNTDSRNLLHIQDGDQRMKSLRQGQFSVVSFLSKMPATKHDIRSFTVDLSLFTPQMLLLTVTGIFKELQSGHESEPMHFFCRTLVVVPVGSGFCIANEQLHVTNATEEQAKHAFKTPVFEPEAAPAVAASPVAVSSVPVSVAIPTMPDENTKQQMIQAMSQESGMNLEWSQKYLESTNWDFGRAEFMFMELQKQGTIPAVAFV